MIDIENNLGFLLAKAYQRACGIFKEEFSNYDITAQQFGLLGFLWQEDGLSQIELSCRSQIDRTTIGGLIDRLEKEGLIKRLPDPGARRAYRIALTLKGKALEEELTPMAQQSLVRLTAPLQPEEVAALRSILAKLRF